MHKDIEEILISEDDIRNRTKELGAQITSDLKGKNPLVLCVLKGASLFMTDLVRQMDMDLEMDFLAVSSYGAGVVSSGEVRILKDLDASVIDRNILIVEDIIDTGLTLSYLIKTFRERGAGDIKICTLLLKNKDGNSDVSHVVADYCGFEVPDKFVVGYGLDYNEKYRNLPYIGVLKEEVYS